ncbi:RNA-directed DNA polymerase, eukaryota [Tanacetum coccineum]
MKLLPLNMCVDIRNCLAHGGRSACFFLPKADTPTRRVKFVPNKVNIFAWKLYLDRLPTRDNLLHRGVFVPNSVCPICTSAQEDCSHLFFKCCLVTNIVRRICRWWNIDWSPLGSYIEWLSWFKAIRLNSFLKSILEGVFYTAWWSIWFFRNQVLFSSQNPRKDVLFDDIVSPGSFAYYMGDRFILKISYLLESEEFRDLSSKSKFFFGLEKGKLAIRKGFNRSRDTGWNCRFVPKIKRNHVATPSVGNASVGSTAELLHSKEWSIASSTTVEPSEFRHCDVTDMCWLLKKYDALAVVKGEESGPGRTRLVEVGSGMLRDVLWVSGTRAFRFRYSRPIGRVMQSAKER